MYCLWLLLCYNDGDQELCLRPYGPHSPKYLTLCPLWREATEPCSELPSYTNIWVQARDIGVECDVRGGIIFSSSVEKEEQGTWKELALLSLSSWQTLLNLSGASTPSLHRTFNGVYFLKQTEYLLQSPASSLVCCRHLYENQA